MRKRVGLLAAVSIVLVFSVFSVFPLPVRAVELFPRYEPRGEIVGACERYAVGETVVLLSSESGKYYLVRGRDGERHQVPWDAVLPLPPAAPALPAVTAEDIADFASRKNLSTRTGILLWVDLWRTAVYVLEYGDEGYTLLRRLPCSVGDAAHPTPRGVFEIQYKCACIGKENAYLCKYALCFSGDYMFHSVLYDWSGKTLIDDRLSSRISHGCLRLCPEDIRWLYDTVPVGSAVYIR